MKLSKLIEELQFFQRACAKDGEDPEVEIATDPRSDEWYGVFDVAYEVGNNGVFVVVINTD